MGFGDLGQHGEGSETGEAGDIQLAGSRLQRSAGRRETTRRRGETEIRGQPRDKLPASTHGTSATGRQKTTRH